jgi:tricarballylate dehydrogenase
MSVDVLVIGGGNAALCAALMAREAGASVMLLESAPREWRGGNSGHTRNLRCMHDAPQDVLVEAYPEEEFWQDLLKVTGGLTDEHLARLAIRHSATCRPWMVKHGVRFQPSLSGALHTARTNAFFMGGGKALVNAYYRSAEKLGVQIHYNAEVDTLELDQGRFVAASVMHKQADGSVRRERIAARTCVLAAGGFRVQPRVAARGLGPKRARRVPGRPVFDSRHPLQPRRVAQAHAGPRRGPHWRPDPGAHGGH